MQSIWLFKGCHMSTLFTHGDAPRIHIIGHGHRCCSCGFPGFEDFTHLIRGLWWNKLVFFPAIHKYWDFSWKLPKCLTVIRTDSTCTKLLDKYVFPQCVCHVLDKCYGLRVF